MVELKKKFQLITPSTYFKFRRALDFTASELDGGKEHTVSDVRRLCDRLKLVIFEIEMTGRVRYPWTSLKSVISQMISNLLWKSFRHQKSDINEKTIHKIDLQFKTLIDRFDDPPYTLQRICEVLNRPGIHYMHYPLKLSRALDRLLSVQSTMQTQVPLNPQMVVISRRNHRTPGHPLRVVRQDFGYAASEAFSMNQFDPFHHQSPEGDNNRISLDKQNNGSYYPNLSGSQSSPADLEATSP